MKKILLATAFIMMVGLFANAQGRDGFFSSYDNGYGDRTGSNDIYAPDHGTTGHVSGSGEAPLGSGLLVLTALGAGYAVVRNKKNRE